MYSPINGMTALRLVSCLLFLCNLCSAFVVQPGSSFLSSTLRLSTSSASRISPRVLSKSDDEEEEIDLGDQDWRAFRAKLVMGGSDASEETASDDEDLDGIGAALGTDFSTMTPLDPSQWAYDSGKVIEQGAVILGGVEQAFGFGLRQQYFHKAAILVLDHDEKTFTKGIILNRPTDLFLEDDINEGVKWKVWFGGDVQGLNANNPEIVCLHSLKKNNEKVSKTSVPVMNDIRWTTFDNAKKLVKTGDATVQDFWVFCGYAGWGPDQLMGELDRKSWYMVATDSQTLLEELSRQTGAAADPRDAGLETWEQLMSMIGRTETATDHTGGFDDLMLKEWALKHLLSEEAGGGGEMVKKAPLDLEEQIIGTDSIDDFLQSVTAQSKGNQVVEGTLVRASSAIRSPFLLGVQALHKSIMLIVSDDENMSIGVMLNRPAAKGIDIEIKDKKSGRSRTETLPLRYGGQYAIRGNDPLLWLHRNKSLKSAGIGSQVGESGIYRCTNDDVSSAIGQGLARPEDFIVVTGVSVWQKTAPGGGGMQAQVREDKFEVISASQAVEVWRMMLMQQVLSKINFSQNLALAGKAWSRAAGRNGVNNKSDDNELPISGLGENFDEEDESLVFKSDKKVADLSDEALRSWVATFLLGALDVDDE